MARGASRAQPAAAGWPGHRLPRGGEPAAEQRRLPGAVVSQLAEATAGSAGPGTAVESCPRRVAGVAGGATPRRLRQRLAGTPGRATAAGAAPGAGVAAGADRRTARG